MALTDEQKIIIGVCVGVAGLILIAIIIFIACLFCGTKRNKHYKRRPYKDRIIHEETIFDDRPPYTVYEKTVPPPFDVGYSRQPLPIPPPQRLPPLPPPQTEVYYQKPRSLDVARYYDSFDRRGDYPPQKRYYSDNRWDGVFHKEPIVVPVAAPEVVYNDAPRREQDVIYLKYVDDQALLPRTNTYRRSEYGYGGGALRRTRSHHDLRRSAYVGEWQRRPEPVDAFNENAYQAGRDPFLWS
ncbi:uncharacterized protein LOC128222971 [Mya arenaria]|uniref:uncharacterized protein LOC128222971 n=1 Tax=Mya arenaria TaxID=6604 RepID=UPI0022E0DFAC|nr:uncharacterized protein LOC128222971 [Mya arenaria]XP_052788128.1 uncharacterized protein LOC128222971 [Mya arenaria]